jgi:hypothetical protein
VSHGNSDGGVGRAYLAAARKTLTACHERIAHCLTQLSDKQVWWRQRDSMNSIGNIVLHLCGNLRQWIVAGVGGAPDVRDRPGEFSDRSLLPRDELLRRFGAIVAECDAVLAGTGEDVLLQPRTVQGFQETVLSALFDCLTHLKGHTQEIVYVTRTQLGDGYRFAWTPTPEQGGVAVAETVEVRDAAFADLPGHPLKSPELPDGAPGAGTREIPVREAEAEGSAPPAASAAPLRDYLRDLEQEFQEEQDEGKVR